MYRAFHCVRRYPARMQPASGSPLALRPFPPAFPSPQSASSPPGAAGSAACASPPAPTASPTPAPAPRTAPSEGWPGSGRSAAEWLRTVWTPPTAACEIACADTNSPSTPARHKTENGEPAHHESTWGRESPRRAPDSTLHVARHWLARARCLDCAGQSPRATRHGSRRRCCYTERQSPDRPRASHKSQDGAADRPR